MYHCKEPLVLVTQSLIAKGSDLTSAKQTVQPSSILTPSVFSVYSGAELLYLPWTLIPNGWAQTTPGNCLPLKRVGKCQNLIPLAPTIRSWYHPGVISPEPPKSPNMK